MLGVRFWTLNSSDQLFKYSPSQLLNDLVCVCQIVEQKIWRARLQSFARPTASRNRNGACAKCVSTGDIVIGIADDVDIGRIEVVTTLSLSAFSGKSAEFVSIVMVIRESAEFKEIPETVMLKLEPCALLQIPGQKGEHNIGLRLQSLE
jgi:hypothetical protein